MNNPVPVRKISRKFRGFLKNNYRVAVPLLFIFALPLMIWPVLSELLQSITWLPVRFVVAVLSILVSLCYPFGALSLSLCTYAWQNEKDTSLKQVLVSLNSVIGPAVSTYLAQVIVAIVPIIVPVAFVFLFKVTGPIRDIYLPFFINAVYWLFYFFTWPLFIGKRFLGFRNAIESVKLSAKSMSIVAVFIAPFILWALLFQILAGNCHPLIAGTVASIGSIALFPLAAVEMIVYQELFPNILVVANQEAT
jgi:hypothetical protein